MKVLYKINLVIIIFFLLSNIFFARDINYDLGLSALMSNRYDVAEIMFKSSYLSNFDESIFTEKYQTLSILAHTYFLDQRYDLAKKCYAELSKVEDERLNLVAKFMFAESCVYSEDYKTAEKIYSETELMNDARNLLPYILYGKIYSLYKMEKYSSVLNNILKFNEINKQVDKTINEQILYLLAESWYDKGSLKESQREFSKFINLYKDSEYLPYVNLRLAQILVEQKEYDSAVKFLQDVSLEKFRNSKEEILIKYNLGKILLKQKKYDLAEKIYLELLENKFNDEIKDYLMLDLGYIYLETKKYDKSIKILSRIKSSEYRIISKADYLLGLSYYCAGKNNEAVRVFTNFISRYSKRTNLYDDVNYWLALSYMNLDKYQEAISIFKYLIDNKSSIYSQPSEFFLAKCYIGIKEYELAKNILNKMLDKVKNEDILADIYYELGQCYKFSFDYSISEQYFRKNITRKDIRGIESKIALADVYVRLQRYDEAERIIKDILGNVKGVFETKARLLLFAVKYNKKDFAAALNVASEIRDKNLSKSEKIFLYNNLSKIYLRNNNFEEAIKCLNLLSDNVLSSEEKFLVEVQKLNIMLSKYEPDTITKNVENLISQYTKPEQITYLYSKLIKYFNQRNDSKKVLEYLTKIQELKNDECLILLSKEEIFEFIDTALNSDINTGLYFAYMISKLPQLTVYDKVDIISKVGQLCVENKQYTSALKFAAILKQISVSTDSMLLSEYIIGKSYESMGKLSNSESIYRNIIEKYSDSKYIPKVYISLINVLNLLGKTDLISKYENVLLTVYADAEETNQYLFETAKRFETEKNYEEAIRRYSMVINSKNLELQALSQKSLGDCYYNLGRYKESSVEYLKVIYLYPQYKNLCAESQFMVGKCCENLKLLDEAKKAYNSSIKNYPETLWAQEAEQHLKILK